MTVYCRALSMGLRDALHKSVQDWREKMSLSSFVPVVADARAVKPPDVTMTWQWDRAKKSVQVDAHVLLADEVSYRDSAILDVAGLSSSQRACLYTFRRNSRRVEAEEDGELYAEPSYSPNALVADYEKDDRLRVRGCVTAVYGSGDIWPVVGWRDKATGERANLFAPDLDVECAADGDVPVVGGGGDSGEKDRPPEIAVGDVFRDCEHCPELVVVPSGRFEMGSPPSEEGPLRQRESSA